LLSDPNEQRGTHSLSRANVARIITLWSGASFGAPSGYQTGDPQTVSAAGQPVPSPHEVRNGSRCNAGFFDHALDQSDGLSAHRSDWSEQDRIHFIFEQDLGNLGGAVCAISRPGAAINPIKLK